MNKLDKYRKSLNEVIDTNQDIILLNSTYDNIINENRDNNLYESIITLSILGKHTKKNDFALHGYHAATSIEMIKVLNKILANNKKYINKYGQETYSEIIIKITSIINRTLLENINLRTTAQNNKSHKNSGNLYTLIQILNEKLNEITGHIDFLLNKNNIKELNKLHYQTDKIKEIALKNKIINRSQFEDHVNIKYAKVCELAFLSGLAIGSGSFENIVDIEKISSCIGMMIKISRDFKNINNDLKYSDGYTTNSVLNLGLTKANDLYTSNKIKFNTIKHDSVFITQTIKELVCELDNNINELIDQSDSVSIETYTLQS